MDHSTKPFNPIEVYKVDVRKVQKTEMDTLIDITLPDSGNVFFVISDNAFTPVLQKHRDNDKIFPVSRSDEFCAFLEEEKKRTEFANDLLKSYLGTEFSPKVITNARILVFTPEREEIGEFHHDLGYMGDTNDAYFAFLPIIVRLIGEKVA